MSADTPDTQLIARLRTIAAGVRKNASEGNPPALFTKVLSAHAEIYEQAATRIEQLNTPEVAALRARVAEAETVIRALMKHSGVSDSAPEDKFSDDHAAESAALRFLSAAPAARDDVVGTVSGATANYLRVCASGGMPKAQRDAVQRAVDHAQRLGYYSMFMLAARSDVVCVPRDVAVQITEKLRTIAQAFPGDKQTRDTLLPAIIAAAERGDAEGGA